MYPLDLVILSETFDNCSQIHLEFDMEIYNCKQKTDFFPNLSSVTIHSDKGHRSSHLITGR